MAKRLDLPKFDLGPIKGALGDDVPLLPRSPVGRLRLIQALANRFGRGFRNVPAARRALSHFDDELNFARDVVRARGGRDGD